VAGPRRQPAAWLTVDPRDNDPVRFWTHFAGAVSASFPELDWEPGERMNAESLEALADRLATVAPMLLVLDDLHFLAGTRPPLMS
jgi:ATP/maltotriose-dependent transcriptional regulator MalT